MALDQNAQGTTTLLALHWTFTRLWTKAMPILWQLVCWTFPLWTLCHQSLTLCVALSLFMIIDVFVHFLHPAPCDLTLFGLLNCAHSCIPMLRHCWLNIHQPLNLWTFEALILTRYVWTNLCLQHYIYLALHYWEEIATRCMDSRTACLIEYPEPSWQLNGWHQSLHTFH